MNYFKSDLNTLSKQDLQTLFKYYNVNNTNDLSLKIYNKFYSNISNQGKTKFYGTLPSVWDTIK